MKGPEGFEEAAHPLGLDFDHDGRATVAFDFDGDGDQDLAVLSLQDLLLLENRSDRGQALQLAIEGPPGAVVEVDGQIQRASLTAGFHSQPSRTLHFGLGAATEAEVHITRPGGARHRVGRLKAGRHRIVGATATPWPRKRWSQRPRVLGKMDPSQQAERLSAGRKPLSRVGKPLLVNFWAPSCEACRVELPELAALPTGGLSRRPGSMPFVAVSLDRDKAASRAFLASLGLKDVDARIADDALVKSFFGTTREIPLPSTFYFDASGQLRRAWSRAVSGAEVSEAIRTAETEPTFEDRITLAERHLRAGRGPLCRAELEKARPRTPSQIVRAARMWLGFDAPKGRAMLLEATRLSPRDPEVWVIYAEAASGPGAAREAIAKALALSPRNPRALTAQGRLRRAAGDEAGAKRSFEAALEAAPWYRPARRALSARRLPRPGAPP